MALIQNPTIARKLQRALRLIGLPDSVLAPETVAVIVVEDLSAPLSSQARGCAGVAAVGAVAAQNGQATLVHVGAPPTYDLIVTGLWISAGVTQTFDIFNSIATGGALNVSPNTLFTDLETPGRPASQLGDSNAVGLPVRTSFKRFTVLADTALFVPLEVRLGSFGIGLGRNSLSVGSDSVNTSFLASFEWTESEPLG